MKKFLSMAAIAVLSFASAQQGQWGVKLGYVNSTVKMQISDETINLAPMSNIYLSSFYEYKLNKFFSAEAGMGIAGLGATNFPSDDGTKNKMNIALFYIPVGVKFYPIENKLSIGAGLNIGFNMGVYGREEGKRVRYDNFNSGNHSLYAGVEYKITDKILAEFRYNNGLNKIIEENGVSLKNNYFQLGIGYVIGKK